MDKKAVLHWQRRIRDILNREWDPIGDCPKDEYDTYADTIVAMIYRGENDESLMHYLEWAEVENMGLGPPIDADHGRKVIAVRRNVVAALRALGPIRSN